MKIQRAFLVLIVIFLVSAARAEWHQAVEDIMGTRITVELWQPDKILAEQAIAAVMADMHAVDHSMSPHIESSELYLLNAQAAEKPVVVSEVLFRLIEKAQFYSRVSDGAFDISFASVGQFYNYRKSVAPAEAQRLENLPAINYQLIELNNSDYSIRYRLPQLKIDLGGIAKGHAVDRGIEILKQRGISSAIVSAGGDSRILGDRQGAPWMIGIRHPRKKKEFAVHMPLIDSAISTSGDYERFYMDGEVRIHHIINPETGLSADKVQSVSILAAHAVDSDALSTTVFVLGVAKGLALANSMPGVEAVVIGGRGRLHYSSGLLRAGK